MFNFTEVSKYIKQHTSTVYMTVKALLLIILLVVILRSCIKSNEEQRIYNLNSATSTASGYTKEIDDLKIKQVEKELLRDSALKCAEANSHTGILVDCLVVKDFPPKTYAGEAASAAQTKTMATETMLTEAQT